MPEPVAQPLPHRHGRRVHSHPHVNAHRHLAHPRLSRPIGCPDHAAPAATRAAPRSEHNRHRRRHAHAEEHRPHGHSHGFVDPSIKRSREGIRAVALSLAVLGATALAQVAVFVASGSIALLADLIHNFGDALTALPLGLAFALHSEVAERRAGLAVVATIFFSACVAAVEAVQRLVHPSAPTQLGALALAGLVGLAGNLLASEVRLRAGRRLASTALIADGQHARADAYVSLAVVASALAVWLGASVADPLLALAITVVILRITWQSWRTVRGHAHGHGHRHT